MKNNSTLALMMPCDEEDDQSQPLHHRALQALESENNLADLHKKHALCNQGKISKTCNQLNLLDRFCTDLGTWSISNEFPFEVYSSVLSWGSLSSSPALCSVCCFLFDNHVVRSDCERNDNLEAFT